MSIIAFKSPNLEATQSPTKGRVDKLRHAHSGKLPSTAQREQGQAITTYTRIIPFIEKSKTRKLTYSDGEVSDPPAGEAGRAGGPRGGRCVRDCLDYVMILRVRLDVKTYQGMHLTYVHVMSNMAQKS